MKSLFTAALVALPLALGASGATAQASFPSKSIRWLVPYPAGGGSDFLARTIGQQLSTQIGQSVVIENKPGAATAIAASEVARAAPDGYTVLSADNGTMVFNPALYSKLSYNPDKDLAPITLMGRFPLILVVGPSADAKDAKDFVAKAKAAPGKISYASAGAGSPHHLAMELLKSQAGLHMVHIPYRGAAPALGDLAGGQIPVMMVDMAAGAGFIKSGKIRPLAVANDKRLPQLPDVPTFAELGWKGVEASAQVGLVGPAGLPADVKAALQKQVAAAIQQPQVRQKLIEFGVEPVGSSTQAYADLIQSESVRWHKLIKDRKITLD
ncbi:tripartite tricarboxylate transporter substrate binding protein [Ottowia sp.]|uniref:Bug family tripartite tricarboxylate transporter substrate binding protein n=1 Tax=Ottowia sp. TaxID=1898956 RepID=UPI002B8A3E0F|nr:tripartite tricarboxylate transporter substrate binding protein [Ottowia sp.]HOB65330.1 tripartite tricarboxylate transporter substrate binding protein [Ottowia sp.]HPZ57728.1 tripartite tricarboxylate transporter substrate binding protein [Ottowia sp.]HQD47226.1 tripartite tricarboxylate transporter substrate binding protein [Ottowia sp.]